MGGCRLVRQVCEVQRRGVEPAAFVTNFRNVAGKGSKEKPPQWDQESLVGTPVLSLQK